LGEVAKLGIGKVFVTSSRNGTGIFEILEYINSVIPTQQKEDLAKLKKLRV
jgi:predicted GTPase